MIPHAKDLVRSLGSDTLNKPSDDVAAFLERIESADPNSPELSEDDLGQCWGHWQFASGGMTCTTVLTSWDTIGTTTARRLIAAAIKTCKVARYICDERNITPLSYLSDSYLQNLVDLLWNLRKDGRTAPGGMLEERPATKTATVTPSTSEVVGETTTSGMIAGEANAVVSGNAGTAGTVVSQNATTTGEAMIEAAENLARVQVSHPTCAIVFTD